jgi:hypothetical protein
MRITSAYAVRQVNEGKYLQTPALGQHKDKQTGIPSPDSLSQAVPPWLADFHL